jgi:hypothetical protein
MTNDMLLRRKTRGDGRIRPSGRAKLDGLVPGCGKLRPDKLMQTLCGKPIRRYTFPRRLSNMSAPFVWRAVLLTLLITPWLAAQSGNAPSSTTTCNLDDGRQVYIRYNPVSTKNEKVANGKPWTPGGAPMTLFTEAALALGSSSIPIGAYTVYPIPARDHWTLAVNKNVTPNAAYDDKQDIARAPMETAQVAEPTDTLEVAFAHVGNRCSLRIYIGKTASFADFVAK